MFIHLFVMLMPVKCKTQKTVNIKHFDKTSTNVFQYKNAFKK